jgi:hypothetical protein
MKKNIQIQLQRTLNMRKSFCGNEIKNFHAMLEKFLHKKQREGKKSWKLSILQFTIHENILKEEKIMEMQ